MLSVLVYIQRLSFLETALYFSVFVSCVKRTGATGCVVFTHRLTETHSEHLLFHFIIFTSVSLSPSPSCRPLHLHSSCDLRWISLSHFNPRFDFQRQTVFNDTVRQHAVLGENPQRGQFEVPAPLAPPPHLPPGCLHCMSV